MCPKQLDTELSETEIGTGLNPPSPESVANAQGDHRATGSPDRQAMMAKMNETDPTAIQEAISDAYDPNKDGFVKAVADNDAAVDPDGLAEQLDQVTEFPTVAKEMVKGTMPWSVGEQVSHINPEDWKEGAPSIISDEVWALLKENLRNTVVDTLNQQAAKLESLLNAQQLVLDAVTTEKDSYKQDCEHYRNALAGIGDHRPAKLEMILIGLAVHYFFTRNRRDAGKLVLITQWLRMNGWSSNQRNEFSLPDGGAMTMEEAISHTLLKSLNMDVVAKHLLEHTVKGG